MDHPNLNTIIIIFFLIPFARPLSFNFTSFTPSNREIVCNGSAQQSNNVIQLTAGTGPPSVGHATYAEPLYLWDRASGNVTDFTTNFSFVINSYTATGYGDGFAFFLAPNSSTFPENATGFTLGLTESPLNSAGYPFVAVEFDILHTESIDPPNEHVGIDINSIRSVANVTWWSADSIREGREQMAWISYNSQSRNLSVIFTGYRNGTLIMQELSYTVDLTRYLPEFVTFGFSGAIGGYAVQQSITSWSFSSNLELVGDGTDSVTPDVSSGSENRGFVIGLVVGGVILVSVLGLVTYFWWKRRRTVMINEADRGVEVVIDDDFERISGPKKFTYGVLKEATDNFVDELGRGGFGSVYKGFLKNINSRIAVKKISSGSNQGIKEYASEVNIISRLRHRNLVQLLGWCHEKKELLLVYEFMPNGSLDSHLFKEQSLLDWGIRFKIAKGLAYALHYLHEECEQYVVHRDIKPSNIMLDSNFSTKLGDFGLARLVDHGKGCRTTDADGTLGYMAPEYVMTGKASKESDVFSFGVVVLEIASGQRCRKSKPDTSGMCLVEWVWNLYATGKPLHDAADPHLSNEYSSTEMVQLMTLGLWCSQPDSNSRPSIGEAVLVLNFKAPLPVLTPPAYVLSSPYESAVSVRT